MHIKNDKILFSDDEQIQKSYLTWKHEMITQNEIFSLGK